MVLNLIAILLNLTRLALKIKKRPLKVIKVLKVNPIKIYTIIRYVI